MRGWLRRKRAMWGRLRRNRALVLLLVVAVAVAIAVVGARLVVDRAPLSWVPALAVAVFGTFLTSMSIIAAFSIEKASRWPTPWEVLDRAHVPAWFLVALGSVVTALLAPSFESDFLSALSLTLAIVAVPLATWGLWELISHSSEQGRWNLVVDLLAHSILAIEPAAEPTPADLGEIDIENHVPASFLNPKEPSQPRRTGVSIEQVPRVLNEYADRRALGAIVRLVDEVHAGACAALKQAGSLEFDQYLHGVETLLSVQRSIFAELASRVLAGQLGDATARIALVRAGDATIDTAGRALRVEGVAGWNAERAELAVARQVAALARFAGHITQEVDAQLGMLASAVPTPGRGGALALRSAAYELQQAGRWAIDPDPPGMKLPAEHPWHSGLASPRAVLIWLWSTVESASGPFGVALYASCQILTGEKFWESYWDGYDVFTAISQRLASPAKPRATAAAQVVRRCGGLELMTLELGATRLAAMPPRQPDPPAFEHDPSRRDDRHLACELFLAAAGFKPPGRDPVADLAHLLTEHASGTLWTTVLDELRKLPDDIVAPPLQPLYRRPEACALAICLRLAPLEDDPPAAAFDPIGEFVSLLPDPLLARTAELGTGLTSGGPLEASRAAREARLIDTARFARFITPGDLPDQEAKATPVDPAPTKATPTDRPPASEPPGLERFEAALKTIGAATSPLSVDLIQLDPRWLEEWAETRAALDARLLAGALRGTVRVRRVFLYDLPGNPSPETTRLHYRWTEALSTATDCFARGEGSPYQVRQVLSNRFGGHGSLPEDLIAVRPQQEDRPGAFDRLWRDRGLFEL